MTATTTIQAITTISAALCREGISKDRKNQQQGYSFRGVEDVYEALAPLLAANGLAILPNVEERVETVRKAKSGGDIYSVALKVRFSFRHVTDPTSVDVVVWGEAMDSADKATNKAMSAAYKYMAFMTFCIPVKGQEDADAETPPPTQAAKPFQTRATAKPLTPAEAAAVQAEIDRMKPKPVVVADLAEPFDLVEHAVHAIQNSLTDADMKGTMARIRASKFQGEDVAIVRQALTARSQQPVRSV